MKGGLRFSPQYFLRVVQKQMSRPITERGFTIVESMIVLAVSGVLFISVAAAISGRQRATEFGQAVQDVRTQLQEFINEVATGYYPNGKDFTCVAPLASPNLTITPGSAASEQGANDGCIFVGKVLHFYTGDDPQPYYGYTIAGRQVDSFGNLVTKLSDSSAQVLAPVSIPTDPPPFSGETQNYSLLYGLKVKYMCYGDCTADSVTHETGSVAFVALGNTGATGSQAVNILPVYDGTTPMSKITNQTYDEAKSINKFLANSGQVSAMLNIAGGVHICFVSGGTDQSALMDIGGNGRAISVTAAIKSNTECKDD